MKKPFTWPEMDEWLLAALKEDIGAGDVTTDAVVDADASATMEWIAKAPTVVCGLFAGARVFTLLDDSVKIIGHAEEGSAADPGDLILKMEGPARALLTGERVALNIVQHLSGVAALTKSLADKVAKTGARIAATRKTMPFMRRLEKYAVVVGGGVPHRFGLDDGVLIKDNHIALAGSIKEAVKRARAAHHLLRIEVEVTNMTEAEEAIEAGTDALLLDNMEADAMAEVVDQFSGMAIFEASGNVSKGNVAAIAKTGVDIISVGALTHSAPAADISARIEPAD